MFVNFLDDFFILLGISLLHFKIHDGLDMLHWPLFFEAWPLLEEALDLLRFGRNFLVEIGLWIGLLVIELKIFPLLIVLLELL